MSRSAHDVFVLDDFNADSRTRNRQRNVAGLRSDSVPQLHDRGIPAECLRRRVGLKSDDVAIESQRLVEIRNDVAVVADSSDESCRRWGILCERNRRQHERGNRSDLESSWHLSSIE